MARSPWGAKGRRGSVSAADDLCSSIMDRQRIRSLVPMAHAADLAASVAFYEQLGLEVAGSFTPPGEESPSWAALMSGGAELMLARASAPILPDEQAVLFYLYCEDVEAMHAQLSEAGLSPGAVAKPFYNPKGEFRLIDPDGYVVMVAHL